MGRHTAADGAPADPLVAAALTRRAPDATRHGSGERGEFGGLGWPGPPEPGDGRTGWPGGEVDDVTPVPAPEQTPPTEPHPEPTAAPAPGTAPVESRRGWRRLFGPRAA